ncbi:hypothetical protein L1987_65029 [Smallanthus sonchifolius]|uniref:Uncharacterized protein n=1 Tax=Smallanthus sonchifolius TaxID=185202 RepID=A0ACB9BT85_9ASTR|nr:hypothetical protein L1987_65029 [Smallanthus sonchifolius]
MADLEESTAATEEEKEAKEKEASVADKEESTTAVALMTIGEATSSSSEDDSPKKDESSSKANSTSSEEFVTASEDGSVKSCPEGVVSEELLTEQNVKKHVLTNGDNCILIEPDIIETNDNLKVMLYGGYKSLNQAKPKIKSEAEPSVSRKVTQPVVPCVSTSGTTRTVQSSEASTSSPAVVESKSPVPVKKQKRSWTAKSKNSQSPNSNSFKDSSILNSHHDYSGCSRHMTGNMALLQDVKPFRGGYVAFVGEKGGNITCHGVVSNGCVSFGNVNFCEQLKHNLLSVSQMCDKEYSMMFDKSECLILKPGFEVPEDWILMRAPRTNDTY